MIGDYIVVAFVFAIALSFVAIIHHFWLRDAFREETPLDVRVESAGKCETYSVLSESSSKAECRTFRIAIQTPLRRRRDNREPFDPGATTLVGRKPEQEAEKKMFPRERMPALSQTRGAGRS